jgi:curved DNA-binding protein CbpA
MNSNYELFELKKPTTQTKLDIAKKAISLKLHPDKHPGEEAEYTEEFEKIKPAYERIKESLKTSNPPKTQIKKEVPKQPRTKEEWLEQKLNFPNKYGMTAQGDLESYDGGVTIELTPKVPASAEHIKQQFAKKMDERSQVQQAYTQAKNELYQLVQGFNASGKNTTDASVIMNANQRVRDAECILNSLTKEPRRTERLVDLKGRDLQIDNPYDVSKIADPVITGIYTTFHWNLFWMTKPQEQIQEQIPEEEASPQPMQGGKQEKTPEEKARIWAIIRAKRARASFK